MSKKIIPSNNSPVLLPTNEAIIVEVQLERLRNIALERLLTPDETKQYDILVKNLLLIRGQPTVINGTANVVEDLDDAELVELAQTPEEKDK
jgi:hypothetical protein